MLQPKLGVGTNTSFFFANKNVLTIYDKMGMYI